MELKLSNAQKEVIRKIQSGVICHYIQGLNARCFFPIDSKNISWATIYKLERIGLVERTETQVVLTELGLKYKI